MRMILSLPEGLVTEFKKNGQRELPKATAFHRAQGNEETVTALEIAAEATNSL